MQRRLTIDQYIEGILAQNRFILSRAITLIESNLEADIALSMQLIEKLLPHTGKSIRIGITGVPGVGKSTFIESFGNIITGLGKKIAVLAIDPSSQKSGGSIMGDKTRMETLSSNELAYIRPSPSGNSLGGVSRKTRETMLLCEAAGYEVILVETVGVGQSETAVANMTDFFLLLMLAGAGDELQGIKKGIMEMADLVAITKADAGNESKAALAKQTYENAIMLFSNHEASWFPPVLTCSALQNKGLQEIWDVVLDYQQKMFANGYWEHKRKSQNLQWMQDTIQQLLENRFYQDKRVKNQIDTIKKQVQTGQLHAVKAAYDLVEQHLNNYE